MEHCSFLGEDVLVEILCKVPDKSLVRLKSVSKAWNLLICEICNNPNYSLRARARPVVGLFYRSCNLTEFDLDEQCVIRRRYHRLTRYFSSDGLTMPHRREKSLAGRYASLLLDDGDGEIKSQSQSLVFRSYGLPFEAEADDFLGCCNGLLLFVNINNNQYYVSNPSTSTGQCVSIPPLPLPPHKYNFLFAALAFDPSRSSHFKIVRFEMVRDQGYVVLNVYSSAQGSWTRHSVPIDRRLSKHPCIRAATYFDGALFRLSQYYRLIRFGGFGFEEDEEEVSVRMIRLPLTFEECCGTIGCLGVLMGQLCYGLGYGGTVRIWSLLLTDDAWNWNLRHTINISDDLSRGLNRAADLDSCKWVEPIAFHPTANLVYLSSPLVVLSYHLENHKFQVLFRNEDKHQFLPASYYPPFPYVRHLAPFPTPTPTPTPGPG